MKTIEEAVKEYCSIKDEDSKWAFEHGVEFAQRWIPIKEDLPKIESGEPYSDRFLLKCKIFKSIKTFLCVRTVYGEFVVEGMKNEILDQHYQPIEWRPIELK